MRTWQWWAERVVLGLLAVCGLLAAGDWVVWHARGGATETVRVSRVVVAPLKGNREEYYADGTTDESCSRSVLPWGGMRACWWVRRQRVIMER